MPNILPENEGGHRYTSNNPLNSSDCDFDCGCEMMPFESKGPEGVDPFGLCPKNSLNRGVSSPTSVGDDMSPEYEVIEAGLLAYLESLEENQRLKELKELIRRLRFEERVASLTPEEHQNAFGDVLSSAASEKLAGAKTEEERNRLIEMYARSRYFRNCAWSQYFHGETEEKPFSSKSLERAANV